MSLYLHICCGPCASAVVPELRREFPGLEGYFHNPNIHPYREMEQRRKALRQLAERYELAVEYPDYDPNDYLDRVVPRRENRCEECYRLRLFATAARAKEKGREAIATTLAVSPYQPQDTLFGVLKEAAQEHGLAAVCRDLRDVYPKTKELSREYELYRQGYCGCIYSEWERYDKKAKHDRR